MAFPLGGKEVSDPTLRLVMVIQKGHEQIDSSEWQFTASKLAPKFLSLGTARLPKTNPEPKHPNIERKGRPSRGKGAGHETPRVSLPRPRAIGVVSLGVRASD